MKNIDECISLCIEIEKYQNCFVRNLFRFNSFYVGNKKKFISIMLDDIHNIPDLLKQLIYLSKNKDNKIDCFLMRLVSKKMEELCTILEDEDLRKKTGNLFFCSKELGNKLSQCCDEGAYFEEEKNT